MTRTALVRRSLVHYWRTNAAVAAGVAVAVAVLAGALLVGDSVRGTLRDLALERLGQTRAAFVSAAFFREDLADTILRAPEFRSRQGTLAPLVVSEGMVIAQVSGRRAGKLGVYGVDDRFWRFHRVQHVPTLEAREAFMSAALARELAVGAGDTVVVRVQRPSAIPLESLHGDKEDLGQTIRATIRDVLGPDRMGEFSLGSHQGEVRAIFLPLGRVQEDLDIPRRVNTVLAATPDSQPAPTADVIRQLIAEHATLEDLGVRVRPSDSGVVIADTGAGVLSNALADAITNARGSMRAEPVLTYLANTIRVVPAGPQGDPSVPAPREIPYSLVSALDLSAIDPTAVEVSDGVPSIVLNSWAALDLRARVGDRIELDYYMWEDPGRLVTRTAEFRLAGTVPTDGTKRDLAPDYPGITDSPTLDSWDPPFPLDLGRIRRVDEQYWEQHRTTPKAFISLDAGQALWRSRYGSITSIRLTPDAGMSAEEAARELRVRIRSALDPAQWGLAVRDVRADALAASRGATDFGQYFVYFSFFLVVSALVLASLFFKLGVEQRVREIGLLRTVGFDEGVVQRLFTAEAVVLSVIGSAAGMIGAVAYAALVVFALRTGWFDAVGTSALAIHVSMTSLAIGAVAGVAAALACTWWSLRGLRVMSARALLAGRVASDLVRPDGRRLARGPLFGGAASAAAGAVLIALGLARVVEPTGGFFGAGALWLIAGLCVLAVIYRRSPRRVVTGRGARAVSRLGLRAASYRPGRSVLVVATIAAATFVLVSVDAFRRNPEAEAGRSSGTGGYALLAESVLPIVHDPRTPAGRQALNLPDMPIGSIELLRLRPGDDVSCLNLYRPQVPRVVGVSARFIAEARFAFGDTLAEDDATKANPWLLLARSQADGAIPVIADANSMTYVLHRAVGDEMTIDAGGRPVKLRFVAALADSIFQSDLIVGEQNFVALFPEEQGHRVLFVDAAPEHRAEVMTTLEDRLADFGLDATLTSARLAEFHRVENTYLSTFQTLGGLGLLLGTVGLAAVLLRNVLERRRELALLAAVGYQRRHFVVMLVAETASLLAAGLAIGGVAATLAILPALVERGGRGPLSAGGVLLVMAIVGAGALATIAAARAATRGTLLQALRSE